MRILFDTSILIAGFVSSHPEHSFAIDWLVRMKKKNNTLYVAAHSIAECFAVLTRLPLSPKISPDIAQYLIKENIEKLATIITLSVSDYMQTLSDLSKLNLSGGIIYDALILKAAKKAKADKMLTLNPKDFNRLIPLENSFILSPFTKLAELSDK